MSGVAGGGALGFAAVAVGPEVALDVGFAVARGSEAQFAEGTLEGLGARVEAHVHLQAAFRGEGGVAHVTAEQFLTCQNNANQIAAQNQVCFFEIKRL